MVIHYNGTLDLPFFSLKYSVINNNTRFVVGVEEADPDTFSQDRVTHETSRLYSCLFSTGVCTEDGASIRTSDS